MMEQVQLIFYGVAVLFAVLYVFLICLFCRGWLKLPVFSAKDKPVPATSVSVVIAARNEGSNIAECLQSLVIQEYPLRLFEIIVVDDDSSDNTMEAALAVKTLNPQVAVSVFSCPTEKGTVAHKKNAIRFGIEKSKGSLIVTTDADCIAGSTWLLTLVAFYEMYKPRFIAGPVIFHGEQSIFQKMQSIEFSGLMISGAAGIYHNKPFMCNGAHLAYEKEAFYTVDGFDGIDGLASGDDVLLMDKIYRAHKGGILFLKSPEAVVYTKAKSTAAAFLQQRIRWASKGIKYMNRTTLAVACIVFGFNLVIALSCILSLFGYPFLVLFGALLTAKCIVDFLFLFLATSFFNKRRFLTLFLPEQLLYILYVILTGFLGWYGRYEWKGRRC